ncbi:MAG TPA: GntR family transcriptional regulator [Erwinia sp.]|uniref:MocR-like pyridoxine biosynthesis transcription factor PdxR n=1 Tax=Erwinia citreus TaxID=558 RepID=UPI000E89E2FB|nr:PLP-dependent aminotransferase family protein [Erwinia sp.]HBV39336.1 GntR family transcriptional regulator [Erwinia sp.]
MPLTRVPLIQLFASQQARTRRDKLCAALRQLITDGTLRRGEQLPSSRLLAVDLSLSRVTVEAAYAQLESEGCLLRQSGKGTFVATDLPAVRPARQATAVPRLSSRGRKIVASGGCDDPIFPQAFAAGSPDLRAFPHDTWRRLVAQRLRHAPEKMMGYGAPQGLVGLREAVARYLAQARGVRSDAGQIIILTSSQQALQMLAMLLCDPGDTVWLEDPGYRGAYHAFNSAGATVGMLEFDDQGARIPDGPAAKLIYLTPSHQYPLGVTMSLTRRLAWLAYARAHGSWLIEDDYDSEFYYHTQPAPALQGLDKAGRVFYLGTFSKTLFPSLRLAYLAVPSALVDACCRMRGVMDGHSALLMQAVTADFLDRGHFQAHLRLMRKLYGSRRELLLAELTSRLGDRLQPLDHQHGLQLTATLPNGGEERLTHQALQAGLVLPRLSPLYQGSVRQEGWLLGFSALQPAEIVSAVEKLTRLFSD